MKYLTADKENKFITLWLNDPDRHNALSQDMLLEIRDFFNGIDAKKTRAVILRGKGKSFCAGADLKSMQQGQYKSEEDNYIEVRHFADVFKSIYDCPVPVIVVTHGVAYGGALGLITAADFVLSLPDTVFSLSEVRLGLSPSTIMPYLLTRLSVPDLKRLVFTASLLDVKGAREIGLIDEIVPGDEIELKLQSFVSQFLNNAPGAVAESKRLINNVGSAINKTLIEETIQSLVSRRKHAEAKEGIQAFFEKRKPNW